MQRLRHVSSHESFLYLWIIGALVVFGALGVSYFMSHPNGVFDGEHEGDVRTVVAGFGNALSAVSLFAPDAAAQIRTAYSPYVTPELLAEWEADPARAPGRDTSSPWPDHIAVDTVTQVDATTYQAVGRIVLAASSGTTGSIPVTLTVVRKDGAYRIATFLAENTSPVLPSSMESIALMLGESRAALGVQITPKEVTEDSRCPEDVACIQEGTVQVRATVSDARGGATDTVFVLGVAVAFETFVVTLADVQPQNVAGAKIADAAYSFTFRVETR